MDASFHTKNFKGIIMRVTEFLSENVSKPIIGSAKKPANELTESVGHFLSEILSEASTAMSAVRNSPYADQLIKTIHSSLALPHNQEWAPVDSISWMDVKDYAPNFVLMAGTKGTAAVKWASGHYSLVTASSEGIQTDNRITSINAAASQIKSNIGKITGFWINPKTYLLSFRRALGAYHSASHVSDTSVDQLRRKRRTAQALTIPNMYDINRGPSYNRQVLLAKLRPLFGKYVQQALADVKGAVGISIKNDAFDRAKKKLQVAKSLQELYDTLEQAKSVEDLPNVLKQTLNLAILMAAGYYYPEETGNISRGAARAHYRSDASSAYSAGPNKVIADIVNGDTKKLSTVMAFLKQELVHG